MNSYKDGWMKKIIYNMVVLLILFASNQTVRATNLDINELCYYPDPNSCDFYLNCLETSVPCGPTGYAQSFGDKYCRRFLQIESTTSPNVAKFIKNTRSCLIDSLVLYVLFARQVGEEIFTNLDMCRNVNQHAFRSHSVCYTSHDNSICFLNPFTEIPLIIAEFEKTDFAKFATFLQIEKIATICSVQIAQRLRDDLNFSMVSLFGMKASILDQQRLLYWNWLAAKYRQKRTLLPNY